jgi:hypothetical protein
MLAASWLAAGWDSEPLRHLAGMSAKDAQAGGRSRLPEVMASLGYDLQRPGVSRWEELPWRGFWGTHRLGSGPDGPAPEPVRGRTARARDCRKRQRTLGTRQGETLMRLLKEGDESPGQRDVLDDSIREVLRSLQATDVPRLADDPDSSR